MKKETALILWKEAEACGKRLSNPNRRSNFLKETYEVDEIYPLSELVAVVVYQKTLPNGVESKRHIHLFIYVQKEDWTWIEFAPSDSHFLGLPLIDQFRTAAEYFNYRKNWKPKKEESEEQESEPDFVVESDDFE